MSSEIRTNVQPKQEESKSARLINFYLRVNQLTYAITAFPIGTVLSVAPIYLSQNSEMKITTIGFFMAGGEALGIAAMVLAERYEEGFLFRRPYDLYFINIALALVLILIPVWREELSYIAATCVMLVQTFNSASKPVVSESIHRLSVMAQQESHIVFAKANTFRRIGNAIIGLFTPLLYAASIPLPFILVGVIMLFNVAIVYGVDFKIKSIYQKNRDNIAASEPSKSEGSADIDIMFSQRYCSEGKSVPSSSSPSSKSTTTSNTRRRMRKRVSTISMLKSYRSRNAKGTHNSTPSEVAYGSANSIFVSELGTSSAIATKNDVKYPGIGGPSPLGAAIEEEDDESTSSSICATTNNQANDDDESKSSSICAKKTPQESLEEGSEKPPNKSIKFAIQDEPEKKEFEGFDDIWDKVAYYLIVCMFPFFDAVITRLPFAYLMIALVEEFAFVKKMQKRIFFAASCLFAYQIGRAISQQIQVWRCDTLVSYLMNVIALLAYVVFVIYVEVSDEGVWWYVPILFTGFAETLPIQQLYLVGLFGDVDKEDMSLRLAVKASHTWTGVGSMTAFIVGSQVYEKCGKQRGVAYLGLTIMVLKITVNIVIDILHNRKEKKTKRQLRNNGNSYADLFTSMRFGGSL